MAKKDVPHYVQVLKRCIPSKEIESKLISVFNEGGVDIDEEMHRRNPNAQKKVQFISFSTPIHVSNTRYRIKRIEEQGHWLYCGQNWYVRKLEKKFEFAQYLIYNTKTKLTEGLWDEEKYRES